MRRHSLFVFLALLFLTGATQAEQARYVETPYGEQKVVFDFFLDDPAKMNAALFWIRSYMNPLMDSPYNQAPEFMNIVVMIHGTEIVTLARHNEEKYREVVERMRYYDQLGVRFKVCAIAAEDYNYSIKDFQPFVELVPSAMTELVHWQQQGYALLTPTVVTRHKSIEEIR